MPEIGATIQYRDGAGAVWNATVTGLQKAPGNGVHLSLENGPRLHGVRESTSTDAPGWFQ